MKFIKKSDLSYRNGYLVDAEGNVHQPDQKVVHDLNELEIELQRAAYLEAQKSKFVPADIEGKDFKPVSQHEYKAKFDVKTPLLDKEIENSMALMDEIDKANVVTKVQQWIEDHEKLVTFLTNDEFIESGCTERFDLPSFGDPLELTLNEVVSTLAAINGYDVKKDDDKE